MQSLADKVALVTGASRGVGKGVATALGQAGMTVYITGRTVEPGKGAINLAGTIHETADQITRAGGRAIALPCDHRNDDQVRRVFDQIHREAGRLDLLVNNVWGGYEFYHDGTEFWKEKGFWSAPLPRWDAMFVAGVRAHYVASVLTAPMMIQQRTGLIVNISSEAGRNTNMGVAYGVAKAADDHMARCMAHDLREHGVAVVSLYPGLVRTEGVLAHEQFFAKALATNSESPQFIGRAIAALAADDHVMQRSGQILVAATLGQEYGFTDIDGRSPTPLVMQSD